MNIHLSHEFLLRFRTQVAMDSRLNLEKVLDYIFQVICM